MTPTQAFLAAAQRTWDVTDSLGRTLTLHQLTALDRLGNEGIEAIGAALQTEEPAAATAGN